MQRFRKVVATRASLTAAAGLRKPIQGARFSSWMTDSCRVAQEQPKNDGFVYFENNEERERTKIMEAEFERILNAGQTSEDKAKLIQLLDPLPLDERPYRERYLFYDWRFALPTCAYILMPFLAQEFIPFNLVMNLDILFLYNSWLWYSFCGPMMGPEFDAGINEILHEVQAMDTRVIKGIQDHIQDNERLIGWESEVFEVLDITDELTIAQVELFNAMEGHAFRDTISTKLDALVTLEMSAATAVRTRMVSAVKSEVTTLFSTDKTAKEKAMAQAIAILQAGPTAKMGKDVVGEAFIASVQAYQANYAKIPEGTDEIFLNLEKDMQAIIVPPVFEATGGNVFETNLIRM